MVMPCSRSARRPSVKSEKSIGPAVRFFDAFSTDVHLILVDRLRIVEQPSDQRALAVVDAAGRADAEEPTRHQKYPSRFLISIEPSWS